jgi:hypothetical protein
VRLYTHKEAELVALRQGVEPPGQGLTVLACRKTLLAAKRLRVPASLPLEVAAPVARGGCPAWCVYAVRSVRALA